MDRIATRTLLLTFDRKYREGNPVSTDAEYDALVDNFYKEFPDDEFFERGILPVANSDRMQKLPIPMFSLEKIKEVAKLRQWFIKMLKVGATEIVFMPKFDGISLLVDGVSNKCWTRGDGEEGQRSDEHYKNMFNGRTVHSPDFKYTWGEAVFTNADFLRFQEGDRDFPYKSNRNAVAGLFNSQKGADSKYLPYVHFVRYGTSIGDDKDKQIFNIGGLYKNTTDYHKMELGLLISASDEHLVMFMDDLYFEFKSVYPIDGVVAEVNDYDVQQKLGRLPNGNPEYAIAFKREEWLKVFRTKVLNLELGVGKTGVINPVINIEPVVIDGVTVKRCTAHNMSMVVDNHICKDSIIEIIRGGEVIPKFIRTISYNDNEYNLLLKSMLKCPSCGEPVSWDENFVDLVCHNENCMEHIISRMTFFFKTMGCEEFDEPTIRKIYAAGYRTIEGVLGLFESELQDIVGTSAGKTVFSQINRVCQGVPLARFMTAMNWFEGMLAENTCQKIFDGISDAMVGMFELKAIPDDATEFDFIMAEIQKINGIGEITARAFLKGYIKYCEYINSYVRINYVRTPKTDVKCNPNALHVCLTGFRDKDLVNKLTMMGHDALNDVTKECNLLVVADMNSTSSKMKTAQKRGVRIITREEFCNEVLV